MDDEMVKFVVGIHGTLGRLEEGQKNTHAYITSVSEGQKALRKDFEAHAGSIDAHGEKATEKRDGKWFAILSLVVSGAVALWKVAGAKISGGAQ